MSSKDHSLIDASPALPPEELLFIHRNFMDDSTLSIKWFKWLIAGFVLTSLFALTGSEIFLPISMLLGVFSVILYMHVQSCVVRADIYLTASYAMRRKSTKKSDQ